MNQLTLKPYNKVVTIPDDSDIFHGLKALDIHLNSSCGGCASCGLCVVTVSSGAENLADISFEERQLLGNVFHLTAERLACQTKLKGDVTIDISGHPKAAPKESKTKLRKKPEVQARLLAREPRAEKPKRLGGGRRPRPFNYTESED